VMVAAGFPSEADDPDMNRWLWRTESRVGPPGTAAPYRGDAFIVAHQDDWQLFFGDRTAASYQAGAKMLFIYTTAGDAGYPSSYWLAREQGALGSADVLAGAGAWTCGTRSVRAHPIQRCVKNNMVTYFMRMPDGNFTDGRGFGFGSIEQIRDDGETINTIDGSTDYETWEDLSKTVAALVDLEFDNQGAPYVNVHTQDFDTSLDPGDHFDHNATGQLVHMADAWHSWNTTYYIGYDSENRPANVTDAQRAIKAAEFQAHEDPVVAAGFFTNVNDPEYQAWLSRTISRTAPPNSPNRAVPGELHLQRKMRR
jgi:GlcNAc-PI de-N-acetylase